MKDIMRYVFSFICLLSVSTSILAQKFVRIQPSYRGLTSGIMLPKTYEDFETNIQTIISLIPNKESCSYCTSFNWGDDELMNTPYGDQHLTSQFDNGNYSQWYNSYESFLKSSRGSLDQAWYCINLVNVCFAHLNEMTNCTAEQKRQIEGQLYFYRAWWHQELLTYFGAVPYIDYELEYEKIVKIPALSYNIQCAST